MYKLPFYIGHIISCFVPGRERRRRVRGVVNVFLYRIPIARFIKKTYGVRANTIKFVRQVSMNRMTCVVNNRYYVKIFRNVSVKQLNDYKFLLDWIRPKLKVKIPEIYVDKHIPMYVADRLPGKDMRDFDAKSIMQHEKQIKHQVIDTIDAMQHIPVKKIPGYKRFLSGLQNQNSNTKIGKDSVLAHLDLNASNLLLDDKFNVISIVDWDSLSIVPTPNIDRDSFENLWAIYKKSHK